MNICNTIRFEVQYHTNGGYRVVDSASGERIAFFMSVIEACRFARRIESESFANAE